MSLVAKEYTNAITLLEKALQLHPGWNDALMVSHIAAALHRPAPLLSRWMAKLSRKTPNRMWLTTNILYKVLFTSSC